MRIDNEFTVDAPIDRVWALFNDVEELAPCMPGTQLTGVEEGVYSGKVKVKVGPVVAAYRGTARYVEQDAQARRVVVESSGRAERGAGNAAATVTVHLSEPEPQRTEVTVATDLKITGKLAQMGGGMIKDVSERLLKQFVETVENKLGAAEADGASEEPDSRDAGAGSEGEEASSHMAGGGHMSGGGHMAGGSHMSGGKQMSGSGPLSGGAADGSDAAAPATSGSTDEGDPRSRKIDASEAEPVDLMAVSGTSFKGVWPMLAVVAALVVGVLVGYAVWG